MASSDRTGVLGSWPSPQTRNCRAHSSGSVRCKWAKEAGCTDCSATSNIHCSRLSPRACACALNAASFSGGRSSATVIALPIQFSAPPVVTFRKFSAAVLKSAVHTVATKISPHILNHLPALPASSSRASCSPGIEKARRVSNKQFADFIPGDQCLPTIPAYPIGYPENSVYAYDRKRLIGNWL